MNQEMTTDVRSLLDRWVEAEVAGDADALDRLAVDDFRLVGPAGFVLDKQQWGQRYRSGALTTTSLALDDVEVRDHGDVAVSISVLTQEAQYDEHAANGTFRVTHLCVARNGDWKLAGEHLSPIVDQRQGQREGQDR